MSKIREDQERKLSKALSHLEYSFKKVKKLTPDLTILDEEGLETWEGFSARFSRVADIFLSRYVRTLVLENDPGFSGTFRDFVNQAEKLHILDNADAWMSVRELRNISAHEYSEKDLSKFFERIRTECPRLLELRKKLG